MTFTIWSNAGKWEWIAYVGSTVIDRSSFTFSTYRKAFNSAMRYANEVS